MDFRLKTDDMPETASASLPNPQTLLIEHLSTMRALNEESWRLVNLLGSVDATSALGRRRAQARAIEIREQAEIALDTAQALARSLRAAGLLSVGS